jgi:hypothetical protein
LDSRIDGNLKDMARSSHARRTAFAGLLMLLAAALPLTAAGQMTAPPAGGANAHVDAIKDLNKMQDAGDLKARVESDRLRDEELRRRNTERLRPLRAALEKQQGTLDQTRQVLGRLFQLPETLKLSADNRALAEATLKPQRERASAAWPEWQEQAMARAAAASDDRAAQIEQVALQLSVRAVNEAALWFADAEPAPSDTIWIEALQREGVCQGLAGTEPAARMAMLIEALPPERRAAAWAGEAARLARWGQETRTVLPPAERTLEDTLSAELAPSVLAKTLASMPPALRAAVQAPGWSLAAQGPAQRCELLRWWSQEQVRQKRLGAREAMLAWRSALAVRSADFLLAGQPRSGAEALDKAGFPLIAHRLELSGRVFVQQGVDADGKALHAFVQRRELRAAALGNQPPLALEHELDQATLERVAAMPPKTPAPSTLQDGVATRRVGIEWAAN